jgi:hypothetical protein
MSTELLERGAESIAKIISEPLGGQRDRNFTLAVHENGKGTQVGCDRAIPNPNLSVKDFTYKIKYLLKILSCCTAQAPMPTRLMQVYERSSGYKPVLPQPFDFSRHARPSEKTP